MSKTKVVNLKKEKYDVYIGRGSKWGNPFHIGKDGNRETVIIKYERHLARSPELMRAIVPELRGKILGCYCAPLRCHGDLLAYFADSADPE